MKQEMKCGILAGIPIALGYFFVSFSFGITSVASGLNWWEAVLVSMTNLTSAGQFAGVRIMLAGGGLLELALSQFVINLRYSLMSISLSQKVNKRFSGMSRWVLGFGITDEIFGVAMSRDREVSRSYFTGLMILPYIGWTFGTLTGAVFGSVLPTRLTQVMGIALYGMFIAIVVPKAKEDKRVLMVCLIAVLLSTVIAYIPAFSGISVGFSIIISGLLAALIGAFVYPIGPEEGGKCDET